MNRIKTSLLLLCCCFYTQLVCASDSFLDYAEKMANSQMANEANLWRVGAVKGINSWNANQAILANAFLDLYETTRDTTYKQYVLNLADYYINKGDISTYNGTQFNILQLVGGDYILRLRDLQSNFYYTKAAMLLREQVKLQPKTLDGIYNMSTVNTIYVYLDRLSFAIPFIARCAKTFYDKEIFEALTDQILLIDAHTTDEQTRLNCHFWIDDETTDYALTCSQYVWGVAQGAFMIAILDVLDYLEEDHPNRKQLIDIFKRQCKALLEAQEPETHLWNQILNMPYIQTNYIETSGSAMFCYAMARGVRKGYLSQDYLDVATESFTALCENYVGTDAMGNLILNHCSPWINLSAMRAPSSQFALYFKENFKQNTPIGVSAFIRAAAELSKFETPKKPQQVTEMNIAFLLPFQTSMANRDPNADRFVDFYVGALIAIQNHHDDMPIRIHTYDTKKDVAMINALIKSGELERMDAIIGPAYSSQVDLMVSYASKYNIPLFIPFTAKLKNKEQYSNVFRFNSLEEEETEVMIDYLLKPDQNIQCVFVEGAMPDNIKSIKEQLTLQNRPVATTNVYKILSDSMFMDLDSSKENILFFNTDKFADLHVQLPHVKKMIDMGYKITMFSRFSWQKETTSIPQIYTSIFKNKFQNEGDYRGVFGKYFHYTHPVTKPRYDLIGYDLTSYIIQFLRTYKTSSNSMQQIVDSEVYNGVQTDIHFMESTFGKGYRNSNINVIRTH